jgi:hypothetical protein
LDGRKEEGFGEHMTVRGRKKVGLACFLARLRLQGKFRNKVLSFAGKNPKDVGNSVGLGKHEVEAGCNLIA